MAFIYLLQLLMMNSQVDTGKEIAIFMLDPGTLTLDIFLLYFHLYVLKTEVSSINDSK